MGGDKSRGALEVLAPFSTVVDGAMVSFRPGDKIAPDMAKEFNLKAKGLVKRGQDAES